MSDRSIRRRVGSSGRRLASLWRLLAGLFPYGVLSVLVVGGWLALSFLVLVGAVVGVITVYTALGRSQGPIAAWTTLLGLVVAVAAAPTLARVAVVAVLRRVEALLDRIRAARQDSWRAGSCRPAERVDCRPPSDCCA